MPPPPLFFMSTYLSIYHQSMNLSIHYSITIPIIPNNLSSPHSIYYINFKSVKTNTRDKRCCSLFLDEKNAILTQPEGLERKKKETFSSNLHRKHLLLCSFNQKSGSSHETQESRKMVLWEIKIITINYVYIYYKLCMYNMYI